MSLNNKNTDSFFGEISLIAAREPAVTDVWDLSKLFQFGGGAKVPVRTATVTAKTDSVLYELLEDDAYRLREWHLVFASILMHSIRTVFVLGGTGGGGMESGVTCSPCAVRTTHPWGQNDAFGGFKRRAPRASSVRPSKARVH
jgi:hypothetical protein